MFRQRRLIVPEDRGPLRVLFVATELFVGGEEMLLVELIRRLDRDRFAPELCCLKQLGDLGESLQDLVPTHCGLIRHKYDLPVAARLARLMRTRQIDAVITVGTGGDKMFWGRLAAKLAGVPVIASAIHSTSYPNRVERSNRLLEPLTDAFIAVARLHADHIAREQGCPRHKTVIIPNGVDVEKFCPRPVNLRLRAEWGIPAAAPVAGIVAVMRPEKNHGLFLRMAARVRSAIPQARFVVVGDGPLRPQIEAQARALGVAPAVHFLGRRGDVDQVLAALDLFVLTSDMEANPVSILEAMAAGKPVVASRVGSIPEAVRDGQTGLLAEPGYEEQFARHVTALLADRHLAAQLGAAARDRVAARWSVVAMVRGYERLISEVYRSKCPGGPRFVAFDASAEFAPAPPVEPVLR